MNRASFQRQSVYNFFNVVLKRTQLQEALYGKHQLKMNERKDALPKYLSKLKPGLQANVADGDQSIP